MTTFWFWAFLVLLLKCERTWSNCAVNADCAYKNESGTLVCAHLNSTAPFRDVRALKVCDYQEKTLNLSDIFRKHRRLTNLTILGGNVTSVVLDEELINNLKVTTFNQYSLSYVSEHPNTVKNFVELEVKNNQIHLKENKWNCSRNLDWLFKLKSMVRDFDNLTCDGEPYNNKPLLPIAQYLKRLREQCPKICNCSMPHVVSHIHTGELEPIIRVNCSRRSLRELPPRLPSSTRILLLQDNDIDDLSPLRDNPAYKTVQDLYLDDNRVRSVEGLEGTEWFTHFRVLSLSGNELSQLPTYALDNALERNLNMPKAVRIFLGGNPWRCDCVYTPAFQEILQKYQAQIADLEDVKCSYVEGDDNSLLPILSLSRSSVCRPSTEYSVRALDLLNIVLASLIVLILSKLAYDYYHFKKTGKLPWIVMKMP